MADDADRDAGSADDGSVAADGADGDGAPVHGGADLDAGREAADGDGSPPDSEADGEPDSGVGTGVDCLLKRRETPEGTLVSVCDADVLGETFENGDVSLEVTEEFYGGEAAEPADADAVVEGLYDADTANLVGEVCVGIAVERGLVDSERVLDVGGTVHAQLLWL